MYLDISLQLQINKLYYLFGVEVNSPKRKMDYGSV